MTEVERMAASFWKTAGGLHSFPADIEAAVSWALPVGVFLLPRLAISSVEEWLTRQGTPDPRLGPERQLHACLIAKAGRGLIFLNPADSIAERRFSLAHEAGHFLFDYWIPRDRVSLKLGPTAAEFLDGDRAPTVAERVDSILSDVSLGLHMHLTERRADGQIACSEINEAEVRADLFATELVAPKGEVVRRLDRRWPGEGPVTRLLVTDFGLPREPARRHARTIQHAIRPEGRSVRDWLGIS